MVNNTTPLRQVSILKISCLLLLFAGCQTQAPQKKISLPNAPAPIAPKTTAPFLAPGKKNIPSQTPPPLPLSVVETRQAESSATVNPAEPVSLVRQPLLKLPDSLDGWKILPLSAREWRVTPLARRGLNDSPPSLMGDAIITSSIHARLQKAPSLRSARWKYSSNAGKVFLSCPSFTPNQAINALRAIIAIDNVTEIRLTTSPDPKK